MRTYIKAAVLIIGAFGFAVLLYVLTKGHSFPLIDTRGSIAAAERNLILTATLVMLTVVIPVLLMTLGIAWRYRATNSKAKYTPNWEHNTRDEIIWWTVPVIIVAGLSVLTIRSSYALDPFRPLDSDTKSMVIQVIALNWKWLFIYPEEGIATVNQVVFPVNVPVDFQITADAPMNSFVIPRLAGQVYAMPGMETHLHLMADETGAYKGFSANFSGEGFADMKFTATALSASEYADWVQAQHASQRYLDMAEYMRLVQPSHNNAPLVYGMVSDQIFPSVAMKGMAHDMQPMEDMVHN